MPGPGKQFSPGRAEFFLIFLPEHIHFQPAHPICSVELGMYKSV